MTTRKKRGDCKRNTVPRRKPACGAGAGPSREQPPTGAEKKLLAEFRERMEARHQAPRLKVDHRPPKPVHVAPAEGEPKTAKLAQLLAFGTTSTDFYSRTFRASGRRLPWRHVI